MTHTIKQYISGLLAEGVDANRTDPSGRTALILAASLGHADTVKALLEHGADSTAASKDGRTAVAALLAQAGKLDQRDQDGMTALHWAAMRGRTEIAAALVNKGAGINAANSTVATPVVCGGGKTCSSSADLDTWGCRHRRG